MKRTVMQAHWSWFWPLIIAGSIALCLTIIVSGAFPVKAQSCGGPTGDPCLGGGGGTSFTPGDTGHSPDCSPIVIDVSGEGFKLTSAQDGVQFDIAGTGHLIQIAWTAKGSANALLCLDRNGNGVIDSGKELFGNVTDQARSPEPNGFLALAEFDKPENGGNSDGVIDQRDRIFTSLRLWIDINHDGISQPEELFTLTQKGITSISLRYRESRRMDQFGNQFRFRSVLSSSDQGGSSIAGRMAYDVFLVTK